MLSWGGAACALCGLVCVYHVWPAPQAIGADIMNSTRYLWGQGYDYAYTFDGWDGSLRERLRVSSPLSRVTMRLSTDQPSVQVYSGNFLNGSVPQKAGQHPAGTYVHWGALALEAQHFPDAVNQPAFSSVALRPGGVYRQTTVYAFEVAGWV